MANKLMHLHVGQQLRVYSWSTSEEEGTTCIYSGRGHAERTDLLMNLEFCGGQSERRGPEETGRGMAASGVPLPSQFSS